MLLLIPAALAQEVPLPVAAEPYPGEQGLVVGPDGTVHVILSRKGPMGTRPEGLYGRLPPGGEWQLEPIPTPGDGVNVSDAALVLGERSQPIVAALGQRCVKSGDQLVCTPRNWVSTRTPRGEWRTETLSAPDGLFTDPVLSVSGDWQLAARWTEKRTSSEQRVWSGVVVYDGESSMTRWIQGASSAVQVSGINLRREGGPELAIFPLQGQLSAMIRQRGDLMLYSGSGEPQTLSEGVEKDVSMVTRPDGSLAWLAFDPEADTASLWTWRRGEVTEHYEIDTGEAAWTNGLAVAPDGRLVGAWYYYRSPYNKGLKIGILGEEEAESWIVYTSEQDNVGWFPSVAIGEDGTVAVLAMDRSAKQARVWRFDSLAQSRSVAMAEPTGGVYRDRSVSLFAYAGGWLQLWDSATLAPDTETFTFTDQAPDAIAASAAGVATQVGFAGHFGRYDFALEYLQRNEDDEAVQKIQELQDLAGKVGIEKFPLPGSETQVHFRRASLAGSAAGWAGTERPFSVDERMLEVRYVGKEGYHLGLRYRSWGGPQDAWLSSDFTIVDAAEGTAAFTEGSFVLGWTVMDYLKKYEVRFFGPYLDAQAGIGFLDVTVTPDEGAPIEGAGLTIPVQGDLGLVAYRRWKQAAGAGLFAQLGYRGIWQYSANGEPEEKGEDPAESYLNFARTDLWHGPYLNLGAVL